MGPVYSLNGAVYVIDVEPFRLHRAILTEQTIGYPMPAERSIDIDTPLDLEIADFLLRRQQ